MPAKTKIMPAGDLFVYFVGFCPFTGGINKNCVDFVSEKLL